jgi:predicted lipid-binding transport protein (Tim44 family)|tara:strand:- start:301 stop:939 length:639 start_codon:yes stop_codon:yes gene_type:complete
MNSFFPFLDIIILGLLALFLGFRLKNLLGDRSGYGEDVNNLETYNEKKPDNNNVINLNKKKISGEGLEVLKKGDPNFSEEEFIIGAKQAFKIIIEAFVDSDVEKLKPLIDYELLKSFTKSISEREARQEKQFVDIISIIKLDIVNISLNDNVASISIKIESEQIKYTIDKNDKIIDGNKDVSEIIKDKWVLERDISSNDPNWKLVETDVVND